MSEPQPAEPKAFPGWVTFLGALAISLCGWAMLYALVTWDLSVFVVALVVSAVVMTPFRHAARQRERTTWSAVAEKVGLALDTDGLTLSGHHRGVPCHVFKTQIGMGDSPPMYFCVRIETPFPAELSFNTRPAQPHDVVFSQLTTGDAAFDEQVRVYGQPETAREVLSWLDDDVRAHILHIRQTSKLRFKLDGGHLVGRHLYRAKPKLNEDRMAWVIAQTVELALKLRATRMPATSAHDDP